MMPYYQRLERALERLNEMISGGAEFPDACWALEVAWRVKHDDLRSGYDAQFETNGRMK